MEIAELTANKIKQFIKEGQICIDDRLIAQLNKDSRPVMQKLALELDKKLQRTLAEEVRLHKMHNYENEARTKGFTSIAGVDEAGRGPLAGPVVAAAVILPELYLCPDLKDSKKLSRSKRQELATKIKQDALWGVGIIDAKEIDQINILQATFKAMALALKNLAQEPNYILVDALRIPEVKQPQLPIVQGDNLSISIAAASIIAKETRDQIMEEMDQRYPGYGFSDHKGYGTAEHLAAIKKQGPSPVHRLSFKGVLTVEDGF